MENGIKIKMSRKRTENKKDIWGEEKKKRKRLLYNGVKV